MEPATRKGVILAGGTGTRLKPLTILTNKHLIPILDRPMVLYPMGTLKDMGVSDICIVTGENHVGKFRRALGDGSRFNVRFSYRTQDRPGGLAHAVAQAEDFSDGNKFAVILGDNIFDRIEVPDRAFEDKYAYVGVCFAPKPTAVAIVEFDRHGNIVGIEEKPEQPKSDTQVVGIYIYPPDVFKVIRTLRPSRRGELEITDVNNWYLKHGRLRTIAVDSFIADAGTMMALAKLWALRFRQLITSSKRMGKRAGGEG